MTDPIKLNGISSTPPAGNSSAAQRAAPAGGKGSFADALSNAEIKFSNHAQKRLDSRDIVLPDDGMARLTDAVQKAEKRGGKESLVLMDDLAFIVNVRDRVVVTALNADKRGEGVFTQIDSVVIADKKS
jgi:flagellar operon protein